jgi:hypothetical protein
VTVLDPRHGIAEPTSGTPPRRAGSIRRTSTVDSTRPSGIGGTLVQHGRARDLRSDAHGRAQVVAEVVMEVRSEYTDGPVVSSLVLDPAVPTAAELVGCRASTGFRAAIDARVDVARGSLAYLLLDDIPGATLVSGFAASVAAQRDGVDLMQVRLASSTQPRLQVADLCAGFQTGGTMLDNVDDHGRPPMIMGPVALSVEEPGDEWAWHHFDELPADSMRRRRRLDVWRDDADGLLRVDGFFRDSHMAPGGVETAVHEYTVDVVVDPESMCVVSCEATARVLPWRECPQAVASARRLAGMPVMGLRPEVRAQFVGPSTCTHLNDVLRGLEDVEWLAGALAANRL